MTPWTMIILVVLSVMVVLIVVTIIVILILVCLILLKKGIIIYNNTLHSYRKIGLGMRLMKYIYDTFSEYCRGGHKLIISLSYIARLRFLV